MLHVPFLIICILPRLLMECDRVQKRSTDKMGGSTLYVVSPHGYKDTCCFVALGSRSDRLDEEFSFCKVYLIHKLSSWWKNGCGPITATYDDQSFFERRFVPYYKQTRTTSTKWKADLRHFNIPKVNEKRWSVRFVRFHWHTLANEFLNGDRWMFWNSIDLLCIRNRE